MIFSEQSGRFYNQHDNQDRVDDRVAVQRTAIRDDHRFRHSDKQTADQGAGNASDTTENSRDERLQSRNHSHKRVDGIVVNSNQDAARAGQSRSNQECERNRGVDADSHQLRRVLVRADRAHRPADFRLLNNKLQNNHQNDGNHKNINLLGRDFDWPQIKRSVGQQLRIRPLFRTHEIGGRVLDHVRNTDRRDQGGNPRGVPQRPVRDSLDQNAQHTADDHTSNQGWKKAEPEIRRHDEGDIRADHVHVAMGEVDEFDDAVHHGVS